MNKQLVFLNRVNNILPFGTLVKKVEKNDVKTKWSEVLDAIYSIDERTGFPKGDLAIFTSADANPEIRAFIEANLMMDNSSDRGALDLPDSVRNSFRKDVSDDDIAAFSRNHDETAEEYADRISKKVTDMKLAYQRDRETRRLKKLHEQVVKNADR